MKRLLLLLALLLGGCQQQLLAWLGLTGLEGGTMAPLTITVVYDNYGYDTSLRTDWGFSAWVEYQNNAVLFDTGGNGAVLLSNLDALNIDPALAAAVVISHEHGDHTGGLRGLAGRISMPPVYLLPSFSTGFKQQVRAVTEAVEVTPGLAITDGIYTTGEINGPVNEEALVVTTARGLVVITGCAHPGIVTIVARAKELFNDEVYLVMGGFHLGQTSREDIAGIIAGLQDLGVQYIAPSHCTGDQARAMFAEAFGDFYLPSGVGRVITVDAPAES